MTTTNLLPSDDVECWPKATSRAVHQIRKHAMLIFTIDIRQKMKKNKPTSVFSEREREITFTFAIVSVRLSSVCLSVCNVRAPYSAGWNLRQCFYAIWYLGHPLTTMENFTEIVPGEPLCRGRYTRGVAKYSDFGPVDGYISKTVQDRR